jgi:hypothetical protein
VAKTAVIHRFASLLAVAKTVRFFKFQADSIVMEAEYSFGSASGLKWASGFGSGIRIHTRQNCPQRRKKLRNFMFKEFSVGLKLLLKHECPLYGF